MASMPTYIELTFTDYDRQLMQGVMEALQNPAPRPPPTRDELAAAALQGLLASVAPGWTVDAKAMARDAYRFADAMLAARSTTQEA